MTQIDTLIGLGMTALLNDHSTREAIVDYIKAITQEHKPRDQWREVYWRQSVDTRIYLQDRERITAAKGDVQKIKTTLVIKATHDSQAGIGRLIAFIWDDKPFNKSQYGTFYIDAHEPLLIESMIATDYMDVIWAADSFYAKAAMLWIEKTTENE